MRRLRARVGMLLGLLPAMMPVCGQIVHASGPLPAFEVATVKLWQPRPIPMAADGSPIQPQKVSPLGGGGGGLGTDRVHFIGQVGLLIASAYGVRPGNERRMIVGGPAWVQQESDRYEVQAKIEDAQFGAMKAMPAAEQREWVELMEQALLAERFKLKVHFETREMAVYALVVAKGGAKLTPAKDGEVSRLSSTEKGRGMEMTGTAVTVEQLAHSPLLALDGDQVVDQTGLQGAYDFTLDWSAPAIAEAGLATDAPPLFPAIQEQLGLRLVPAKAQVEVVVIDHVERPSAN